jgi:DNA repair protein REV1
MNYRLFWIILLYKFTYSQSWLEQFDLQDLPSLGWAALKKLKQAGVTTVAGLRAMSRESLCQLFGVQSGARLHRYVRGQDDREIFQASESDGGAGGGEGGAKARQSIGVDLTYGVRFSCDANIYRFIVDVAKELVERMKATQLKGKKVGPDLFTLLFGFVFLVSSSVLIFRSL